MSSPSPATNLPPVPPAPSHARGLPAGPDAHASPMPGGVTEVVIEPPSGWVDISWSELKQYRELLYLMVWRDLTVRYKQTVLGFAWAVVQPTFQMVIFTVIFGRMANLPSDGFPYPLFCFVGLLPWTFFSQGVLTAGVSLVNQQHLLSKVYFPRLYVPTTAIGTCLVDFLIGTLVCVVLFAFYQTAPSWQVIFVPLLLVGVAISTLGLGYLLAALTVQFRDLRLVVPFLMQALMYLSPVVYPVSMVPQKYQWLLALNPMAGLIDGFRSAVLGKDWNFTTLAVSSLSGLILFVVGLYTFRQMERNFADLA